MIGVDTYSCYIVFTSSLSMLSSIQFHDFFRFISSATLHEMHIFISETHSFVSLSFNFKSCCVHSSVNNKVKIYHEKIANNIHNYVPSADNKDFT